MPSTTPALPIKRVTGSGSLKRDAPAVNLDKEEGANEYCPGGYHPIQVGDELHNRYLVVRKLGWGHFSTVWLVQDQTSQVHVALKVVKSSPKYAQTARDEIALLNHINSAPNPTHPGRHHIVGFLDSFDIPSDVEYPPRTYSPNGYDYPQTSGLSHVCMTFEPLGENLLSLLRRLETTDKTNLKKGIPRVLVQQIAKQMLQALDFLHTECRLIHTDMKPENVMVVVEDVEELVRACAAAEEITGTSPSTASRLVPIPKSGGRYDPGGGDWHNEKNVHIFGSYPLPSPKHEWGRINAGEEVSSLALIMNQLAEESIKSKSVDQVFLGGNDGAVSDLARAFGASSLSSTSNGSAKTYSSTSTPELSTAPTSLGNSAIGFKSGSLSDPLAGLDFITSIENDRLSSVHSDSTLHVDVTSPLSSDSTTPNQISSDAGAPMPPFGPTPTPTSPPALSLLTANAPQDLTSSQRGRALVDGAPVSPLTPAKPAPPRIRIKIADMGNATPIKKHFTPDIQTRQYRCPEVILGYRDWGPEVDVWSVGCMIFELLTSDFLFAPQAKPEFTKDDDHMAQVIELLGDMPEHRKHGGKWSKEIFRRNGQLRNISRLRPWNLQKVMEDKYDYSRRDARAFREFLEPMLALDPSERATAEEMTRHPWLDPVEES